MKFTHNKLFLAFMTTSLLVAPAFAEEKQTENKQSELILDQYQEIEALKNRLEKIEKQSKKSLKAKWKGAPVIKNDKGSEMKIRGRLHFDTWSTNGSNNDEANITGTEIRRARMGIEGNLHGEFKYKFELDFAGGKVKYKDAYLAYTGWKNQTLYAGLKKSDWSLANITSSRYSDMIEQPLIVNGLAADEGSRSVGLMYTTYGKNWHWSGQFGGDGPINDGDMNDTTRLVTRAHYAPILTEDAVFHLGGWAYKENFGDNREIQSKERLGNHFNDLIRIKSGKLANANSANAYGLETVGIWGSFHVAAEYITKSFKDDANLDPTMSGYYLTAGYFLTGEMKKYKGKTGTFSRQSPNTSITKGGIGAWQVLARVDRADFNDSSLPGGEADTYTLGLNWWPTAHTRVMLNYVNFDLAGNQDDNGNHIGLRVAVDW
jgi:phosphate-selective porin OprO/OprP